MLLLLLNSNYGKDIYIDYDDLVVHRYCYVCIRSIIVCSEWTISRWNIVRYGGNDALGGVLCRQEVKRYIIGVDVNGQHQ